MTPLTTSPTLFSFQGIILLAILENPLTWDSYHVSNVLIFAAWGVTTSPALGARKHYQPISWGWKVHFGQYSSPKSQICKILVLGKSGSLHCVSNGFLNQRLHMVSHSFFWIILDWFPFDAIHIVAHMLVYDDVMDIFCRPSHLVGGQTNKLQLGLIYTKITDHLPLRVLRSPNGFVLDLPLKDGFWKQSKWPRNTIHSMPCRLYIHLAFTCILLWSLKRSVKRTWTTPPPLSTNESALIKVHGHGPSGSRPWFHLSSLLWIWEDQTPFQKWQHNKLYM